MNLTHLQLMRPWLNRTLEATWLVAILLIPLVVLPDSWSVATVGLPKTVLLRIISSAAVIAWLARFTIWSTELTFFGAISVPSTTSVYSRGIGVLDSYSKLGKLIILSVVGLGLVNIVSTVFSIDPTVSFWGKRAGYEGYGLYNTLSLLVLFFTVSARLRTREQLWRLVYVAAAVGIVSSLIGILQSVNAWPVMDKIYLNRVSGHSGNPIAYGGLVTLLFPFGILAVFKWSNGQESFARLWLPIVVSSSIFMYAVGLTLSRGPYVGMGLATFTILAIAWWGMGTRIGSRLTGTVLVSVLLVGFLMVARESTGISQPTISDAASSDGTLTQLEEINDRVTNTATVSTRLEIWRASQDLIAERPGVPGGQGANNTVLRHLVGYGPDQFRYVFGLTAEPLTFYRSISEAHNDFLNKLVEIGLLGLITFLTILVLVSVLLFDTFRKAKRDSNVESVLLIAAISAALAGWMIQQQTGIPRNADLTIFWLLLGVVVALPRVFVVKEESIVSSRSSEARVYRTSGFLPAPHIAAGYSIAMLFVTLGIVGTVVLAWDKSIDYVRADHSIQLARNNLSSGSRVSIEHFETAIELAPDVAQYRTEQGDYLEAIASNSSNPSEKLSFTLAAHEANHVALEINRLERNANFHVAESAWTLAQLGYPELADEAVERYRYLNEIAPQYQLVQQRLALMLDLVSDGGE